MVEYCKRKDNWKQCAGRLTAALRASIVRGCKQAVWLYAEVEEIRDKREEKWAVIKFTVG